MANASQTKKSEQKLLNFAWEGKDRNGRALSGEIQAPGEAAAKTILRQKSISVISIKRKRGGLGQKVKQGDVAIFTRQLATMMKAGVPLLKAFDIVSQGNANPTATRLLNDIKAEIENGNSLAESFGKFPKYFDKLYCSLVEAGEKAGILEDVLDRLATYMEKTVAIKASIKSALTYPIAIISVALAITAVIMIFVIPAFKAVFASFNADLPTPTVILMACSDFVVKWWYIIFGLLGAAVYSVIWANANVPSVTKAIDRMLIKMPIFGKIIEKAIIARWTRTLQTMFAAGVPLVDALNSVAGAAGNDVYVVATRKIQADITEGQDLTTSMESVKIFPNMVTQMTMIGEESGALDTMLGKVADFYEREVDEAVASISKLMEPIIMVILGVLIGGMVVAMYLPIFKLGAAAGT